jgi:ParB family transcriptional regulator, chromosome partitioning protein
MTALDAQQITHLPVDEIWPDPDFNCRGSIAPIDVVDLAKDIESKGLQQPIVVQSLPENHRMRSRGKNWKVVCGHRRHRAFQVLKRDTIPCVVNNNLTDVQALLINLGENIHRKDLNILQEAQALQRLKNAGMPITEVATQLEKSTIWVRVRFILLELPVEIQTAAATGLISQQQLMEIYGERDPEKRLEMARKIKEAKIRGEKAPNLKKDKKRNIFKSKVRNVHDMEWMQDHIRESIGNNFGTRVLAWAMGVIPDLELFHDIKGIADKADIDYDIPYEVGGFNL